GRGGTGPAAVNGANEAAVALFLQEKIGWLDIGEAVCAVADTFPAQPVACVGDVLEADRAARAYVAEKFCR
ncbi:MAG: 1-deoxy-D-xylulose-5-phosphate reductoisomerase, partial [Acutalibacteraceae bacterium]|nr:1-deoxy-D-xylulose-5-phosphate reductoisomerase [Acutalibacteraceae bacterium]